MYFKKVHINTAFDLAESALPELCGALLALGDDDPNVVLIGKKVSSRGHQDVHYVSLDEHTLLVHFSCWTFHH